MNRFGVTGSVILTVTCLLLAGCRQQAPTPFPGQSPMDPPNVFYAATVRNGAIQQWDATVLPAANVTPAAPAAPAGAPVPAPAAGAKIDPRLAALLADAPPDQQALLVVTLVEDAPLPVFPEPPAHEPRASANNQQSLATAQTIIRALVEHRAAAYDQLAGELEQQYGASVLQTFWLLKAMLIQAPLRSVPALAERPDVLWIELEENGAQPPMASAASAALAEGNTAQDPPLTPGSYRTWQGLLADSVRAGHLQAGDPARASLRLDCTADPCAPVTEPAPTCAEPAAGAGGPAAAGSEYAALVDSYGVYAADCSGLRISAALAGWEQAVANLDRVIVADLPGETAAAGALAVAANRAFMAGAVVLAPLGKNSAGASEPAVAPPGGAPAVQAVHAIGFGETGAGAAPSAADAAVLLRDWLRVDSGAIDPGQVNAWLVLGGWPAFPFASGQAAGQDAPAGRLPTDGRAWWGKLSLHPGASVEIPLDLAEGELGGLGAALWRPDGDRAGGPFDLRLVAPDGGEYAPEAGAMSGAVSAVVRVSEAPQAGSWRLRITAPAGSSDSTGVQIVYWAAHAPPSR